MKDLQALFAELRAAGIVSRDEPPIARVPEQQATIWYDVRSAWAKPDWSGVKLLFGICHSYPAYKMAPAAGAWIAQAGPWFETWLARAKAEPMHFLAERRADGSGAIVWREDPTRETVFARLAELEESREAWTPKRVVANAKDPSHAWSALIAAGLLPPQWANEPRRRFRHVDKDPCNNCGGTGVGIGYGETSCYAGCNGGYFYRDRWEPLPSTVAECEAYAERASAMARYEALVFDLLAHAAPWQKVTPTGPLVVRWSMFSEKRKPRVPTALEPAWRALQAAVPDAALPDLSPSVRAAIGWADQGANAWSTAVARKLTVPKEYDVPDALVGRPFADLPNAFANASALESLPFDQFALDATSVTLWLSDPRAPIY
ncbi:MAG TPA: hypothetical protein VIF62_27420 [Labilithrix sp.]